MAVLTFAVTLRSALHVRCDAEGADRACPEKATRAVKRQVRDDRESMASKERRVEVEVQVGLGERGEEGERVLECRTLLRRQKWAFF